MIKFENKSGKFISSYTLESKGRVIGSYHGEMRICPGPLCECEETHFTFSEKNSRKVFDFTLDLKNRELKISQEHITDADSLIFGEMFARELDEEKWKQLMNEYLSYKIQMTEHTDLKKIDAVFPLTDIEENQVLVGYYDILPYGQPIWIEIDIINYLIDDHYCVRPECKCTDCILAFLPADNDESTSDIIPPSVMFDYETSEWKIEEDGRGNLPPVVQLMEKLKLKYPEISSILKRRHTRLRTLYKQYKKKSLSENNEQTSISPSFTGKKPGRNQPCSCGSGKKYKYCCGK